MAQYEEQNKIDYRQGGDTVDDFARKYIAETTRIFRFLNDLRELKTNNIEYTEPVANQLKAEDDKLYIRNKTNTAWILLGNIDTNFGFKPADADFISSAELSHEKITDVNGIEFNKIVTTDNLPQAKIDEVNAFDHDKAITTDDITKAKIGDVNAADLPNMLVERDISIPAEGLVTTEPQKLVRTNNDGVLPVNILGNAAKLAGIRVDSDIIQDGQVLTYRAATNTWHNENKGVIGSGKALNLYDGEELLCSYVGDETRDFDLGITANKKYVEDLVDSKADKTELANYLPLSGGAMTAPLIKRNVDNSGLIFYSGTNYDKGAYLTMRGKDYDTVAEQGTFELVARAGSNAKVLKGKPDGTFTFDDKYIATHSNANSANIIGVALPTAYPNVFTAGTLYYYCFNGICYFYLYSVSVISVNTVYSVKGILPATKLGQISLLESATTVLGEFYAMSNDSDSYVVRFNSLKNAYCSGSFVLA